MLCLIARIDEAAAEKLRALRRAALGGTPDPRPLHGHITVAACTGDEAGFIRFCRELAREFPVFPVEYRRLEVWEATSILVAVPEPCRALEEMHRRIAAEFAAQLDRWSQLEHWQPHTTLFCGPGADLPALCRRLSEGFVPVPARVTALEFSRVLPSGYEIIGRIGLSDD